MDRIRVKNFRVIQKKCINRSKVLMTMLDPIWKKARQVKLEILQSGVQIFRKSAWTLVMGDNHITCTKPNTHGYTQKIIAKIIQHKRSVIFHNLWN